VEHRKALQMNYIHIHSWYGKKTYENKMRKRVNYRL
jgi:hypothetical protein